MAHATRQYLSVLAMSAVGIPLTVLADSKKLPIMEKFDFTPLKKMDVYMELQYRTICHQLCTTIICHSTLTSRN